MTELLPTMTPTEEGAGSGPPPPPPPPEPTLTVTAVPVNGDCDARLPGEIPGIFITVTSEPPANIVGVTDASFEDGTTGSAVPSTGGSPALPTCVLQNSIAEALDGTHSLELVCTAEGATAGSMGIRLGPYAVIPGRAYTITANVRGGAARSVVLDGVYVDRANNPTVGGTTTVTDSNSGWMSGAPFLVLSNAPSNAVGLYIDVTIDSAAGPIIAPTGMAVTPTGTTGSTVYSYVVTAVNAYGESLPGGVVQITDGAATLSYPTRYNALSWSSVSGATGYNIYRASPGDCGELPIEFATCADILTTISTCAGLLLYVGEFGFVAETTGTTYHDQVNALGPSAPPTMDTTGEPAWIDEVGAYASTTVDSWSLVPPGTVTLARSDGKFVLGASPLFPLMIGQDGTAEITDWNAPYGELVTYVAVLTQLGKTEAPSQPAEYILMGQAPDTCALYERLGWAKDEDASGLLEQWLAGPGQMLQALDSICTDSYDTDGNIAPSWSTVLDIKRCPTAALPWLGQFVGARLPTTLRDDQMRYEIENSPGWQRGTAASILAAANRYLTPGYAATLSERDPDPYSLTITVPNAGVIGNATCESLFLAYATCLAVFGAFATCADLWAGVDAIENSINAAIPAGLIASIDFD